MTNDIMNREPVPRLPPAAERRRLRELFGVTQTQLAESMGVDTRTVRRWEQGMNPTGSNLIGYGKILAKWGEREAR